MWGLPPSFTPASLSSRNGDFRGEALLLGVLRGGFLGVCARPFTARPDPATPLFLHHDHDAHPSIELSYPPFDNGGGGSPGPAQPPGNIFFSSTKMASNFLGHPSFLPASPGFRGIPGGLKRPVPAPSLWGLYGGAVVVRGGGIQSGGPCSGEPVVWLGLFASRWPSNKVSCPF